MVHKRVSRIFYWDSRQKFGLIEGVSGGRDVVVYVLDFCRHPGAVNLTGREVAFHLREDDGQNPRARDVELR